MIVKEIKGNLLDTEIQHIAHGVNCQNVMGSGVARALYQKWSKIKEDYHTHFLYNEIGAINLGSTITVVQDNRLFYNMFTQNYYSNRSIKNANYAAIAQCFKHLANNPCVKEVAIPRIGCGLAGGDWEIVKQIINDATLDDLDVYVYYL